MGGETKFPPLSISTISVTNDGAAIICSGEPGADDRKPVAHVLRQTKAKRADAWKASCAERDALATLFVAAPELYEAGTAVVREWTMGGDVVGALRLLTAALNKATSP